MCTPAMAPPSTTFPPLATTYIWYAMSAAGLSTYPQPSSDVLITGSETPMAFG